MNHTMPPTPPDTQVILKPPKDSSIPNTPDSRVEPGIEARIEADVVDPTHAPMESPVGFTAIAMLVYGAVSLLSLGLILWREGFEFFTFSIDRHLANGLLLALVLALFTVGASQILSRYTLWTRRLETELSMVIGPLPRYEITLIAIASSIGEETFFRGLLQPYLGLVITSTIFGLVHVPATPALRPWTLFALLMGFVLGSVYQSTGSLLPPILLHFLVNDLNLAGIVARHRKTAAGTSVCCREQGEKQGIEPQSPDRTGRSVDANLDGGRGG